MSKPGNRVLESGLLELTPDLVEALPEGPAVFRLRSPAQRVMFVGHAGEDGLRAAVAVLTRTVAMAGMATLEYESADSAEEAATRAETDITELKPLYNDGFGRFRNSDLHLPKKGHRIRAAMRNP